MWKETAYTLKVSSDHHGAHGGTHAQIDKCNSNVLTCNSRHTDHTDSSVSAAGYLCPLASMLAQTGGKEIHVNKVTIT